MKEPIKYRGWKIRPTHDGKYRVLMSLPIQTLEQAKELIDRMIKIGWIQDKSRTKLVFDRESGRMNRLSKAAADHVQN